MRLLLLPALLTMLIVIQTSESRHLSHEALSKVRSPHVTTVFTEQDTALLVQPLTSKNKVKRNASRRSWSGAKSYNNPPPYLVFNRKIGAYYPYYSFPSDSNIRRSRVRKVGRQ